MLSDLLISPSPTCQHGNRKLHRRQLPRNLSPVFRIMKRHPAPAKRNHTLRNPLIRLRIPVPDTSLDQPPQKPMMLNKRLQKPIHLRQLPAPEHLLLRLRLMLSVDRTHRHHTVDIRHTDRIRPLRHKQSSLPHPISTPYLPVKISMVSHHIRGKKPQSLRKHPAVLPKSRHPIRRQMKQNRPHIPRQKTGRINILRNLLLHSQLHTGLDSLHPPLSRRHIPQRQIRIPIQNTRRKLQLNNPAGQIPPRDLTTLLRLPRKIKKLSPRNIQYSSNPHPQTPQQPPEPSQAQKTNSKAAKPHNHTYTPLPPKPRQPPKTTLKTKPTNLYHNYNPKSPKNKFKYYTKTPAPPPHTHNTSSAALMAHRLPAHHKKTQPHTPKKQNGQTASHPTKKEPQAQTPRNSPKTKQHHLPLRNFLSSLSNRSARAVTENL